MANGCTQIILVSSHTHFSIVHHIESSLFHQTDKKPKLVHIIADTLSPTDFFDHDHTQSCLIVTVGAKALAVVLKTKPPLPILSVLIRKNIFFDLLKENEYTKHLLPQNKISAIYLDQPLARQLHLLEILFPKEQRTPIGVLFGKDSSIEHASLQTLTQEKGLKLLPIYVNPIENPVAVLDSLLNEAKVVLALPDKQIYHPHTTKGILLTTFHRHVPLIGYSRTFVSHGALAAVYVTTKQLAEQTIETILIIIKNKHKKLPPPTYPHAFSVAVNSQVAHSLGITLNDEATLKYTLQHMEQPDTKKESV